MHERERDPVIQAGFSGQTEPNGFGIVLVLNLHIRRKNRIGGRQQRAQQHGCTQRQTKRRNRERGDSRNGEHHRNRRELKRAAPAAIRYRQPQLQTCRE